MTDAREKAVEAVARARDAIAAQEPEAFGMIDDGHGHIVGSVRDQLVANLNAALDALGYRAGEDALVTPGMRIVPVEPTEAMRSALGKKNDLLRFIRAAICEVTPGTSVCTVSGNHTEFMDRDALLMEFDDFAAAVTALLAASPLAPSLSVQEATTRVLNMKLRSRIPGNVASEILEVLYRTAAPSPESGWRDLATAPRDGTRFLAFTADYQYGHRFNERVQEARWSGRTPDDRVGHFQSTNGQIVVAWQPLPPPPAEETET